MVIRFLRFVSVFILVSVMLSSCSISNSVVSSFGKRKYTKGYFVNMPGSVNNERSVNQGHDVIASVSETNTGKTITDENSEITDHIENTTVSAPALNEVHVKPSVKENIAQAPTLTKELLPDTNIVADTIDDYAKDKKIDRVLGITGFVFAVAGAVCIFLPNFILAPILIVIGLAISAIGVKRGSNSLFAFIGFVIGALGVVVLLSLLIAAKQ
jgi:hypothetical protein